MADWTMKAHDERPSLQATLLTGGVGVDLSTATGVDFIMVASPGGSVKVSSSATVVSAANGIVRYDWVAADTDTPGEYDAEFQVTWDNGDQQTFPTDSYLTVTVVADLDGA